MITTNFRPTTLSGVVGQPLVVKVLRAIVKDPQRSPRSIVLDGPYGSGKTTCARAFARALLCPSSDKRGDACGKPRCVCQKPLEALSVYELDAAVIGVKEEILALRDMFVYDSGEAWRVFIVDEAHLISKAAQSALLKVLEEAPSKAFFVFPTTDSDKLLPTVLSRSLRLRFSLIPDVEIRKSLLNVCNSQQMEVSSPVVNQIIKRANGHLRDAYMLLDSYILIGDSKEFIESIASAEKIYLKFFYAVSLKDKAIIFSCIDELTARPLEYLKADFYTVISLLLRAYVSGEYESESYKLVASQYREKLIDINRMALKDWVLRSFGSNYTFQAMMLSMYELLSTKF